MLSHTERDIQTHTNACIAAKMQMCCIVPNLPCWIIHTMWIYPFLNIYSSSFIWGPNVCWYCKVIESSCARTYHISHLTLYVENFFYILARVQDLGKMLVRGGKNAWKRISCEKYIYIDNQTLNFVVTWVSFLSMTVFTPIEWVIIKPTK